MAEQVYGAPKARIFKPSEQIGNPGESFLCQLAEIDESRAFSANDGILSCEPQITSLAEIHPQIERRSADNVQALRQRNSAGAHQCIEFESSIVSDFDLDEI